MDMIRKRFQVTGVVQGVGFRPFVAHLATRFSLAGFVMNDSEGVVVEIEGLTDDVALFRTALEAEAPVLASIESVGEEVLDPRGDLAFEIGPSRTSVGSRTPIGADMATCDECLTEIHDRESRRFRYPFTNCTNCGPRFTIISGLPYDRSNTTMRAFQMCDACLAEYEDPKDRRYHAQPIACPECGPILSLVSSQGAMLPGDPLATAAEMIRAGQILAVKGLGGYHLVCDATNDAAVRSLRRRKAREEKPLAVMVAGVTAASSVAHLSDEERSLLVSPHRPIVLVEKRPEAAIALSVAPGNRSIGLMLPYTPLHHLLLADVARPVVMTSGNLTEEPIAYLDEDAQTRLGPLVDAILRHDRPIRMRCDDSVVRVLDGHPYPIRRSRGLAPQPLHVEPSFPVPVMGAGAQLKHTFCLGASARAILSHHIGDLQSYEAMVSFEDAAAHFIDVFDIRPEIIAHDLHPDYLSTKWALQQGARTLGIQHHHAHVAACLADNRRSDRVIGLALDGTGLGDDGTLWGCEVLVCDLRRYEREGHLVPVPLPGGEAAVREPWRMAAVYLQAAFGPEAARLPIGLVADTAPRWEAILKMADAGINSPQASSAGRLFDAVAALCCNRRTVSYEGQAAASLEQLADPYTVDAYSCRTAGGTIEGVDLVAAAAEDLVAGTPAAIVAGRFHNGLARALASVSRELRDRHGLTTVALSGGTFQNLLLLARTRDLLERDGFEVLVHRRVPTNDGGISLGQAVIAAAVTTA